MLQPHGGARGLLHIHSTSRELLKLEIVVYMKGTLASAAIYPFDCSSGSCPVTELSAAEGSDFPHHYTHKIKYILKNAEVISLTRNHAQISNKNIQVPKNIYILYFCLSPKQRVRVTSDEKVSINQNYK